MTSQDGSKARASAICINPRAFGGELARPAWKSGGQWL